MEYTITSLPKEKWKGKILPMGYTSQEYYDVEMQKYDNGYTVNIVKKTFTEPVEHTPEEYDFPDRLYEDHWDKAYAWGVLHENELIAAIETAPEEWSNRLRVTELWVDKAYRRQGIAHSLMSLAREQARRERRRAIILETQSCNADAIAFYEKEGFLLIGFDSCCYKNEDLSRKEVRLEFGLLMHKKPRLLKDEICIREITDQDWHETELMTQHAFWNKHHLGCDEHYLVHKLKDSDDYIQKLSRIALKDGKIIGCILFSKAYCLETIPQDKARGNYITGEHDNFEEQKSTAECDNYKMHSNSTGTLEPVTARRHELITFGPLCIEPEWQGCGVGELLLEETKKLAADMGYPGIVIFGEPDYYPRLGFLTCDHFDITTKDGKNFDAFMGFELREGSMKKVKGRFYESEVFDDLPKEEVEEFNQQFPPLEKMRFPGQWD